MNYIDYFDYAVRSKKTFLEIMNDFQIDKVSINYCLDYLYNIQARDYSIVSY
jgi:hypothetical protein